MSEAELTVLQLLEAQYYSISGRYNNLLQQAEGALSGQVVTLRRQAADALNEANKNWVEAQNRIFNESDALIRSLIEVATEAQKEIDRALQHLEDIKNTLNAITKAVKTVGIVISQLG